MEGFIQLHRKICEWEWYTDIPTKTLFFHILLKCNYKEAKWRGKIIKPGELITSSEHLAIETGLTRQQIRTAIKKLESTGEITYQATNEYTILGMNNWTIYNQRDNQPITNEQPTDNQPITTTNKYNKDNKDNKDTYRAFAHLRLSQKEYEALIAKNHTKEEIDDVLDAIENYKKNTQYKSLYLTATTWLKRDIKKKEEGKGMPLIQKMQREGYSDDVMNQYMACTDEKFIDKLKEKIRLKEDCTAIRRERDDKRLAIIQEHGIPVNPTELFILKG